MIKKKKWYWVIIVSYIIVFLIPMILNIHSLQEIKSSVKEDICRNISDNLEHASVSLDNSLRKIDDIIEMVMENEDIVYMAVKMDPENSHREFSRQKAVKLYLNKVGLPPFVDEFYLWLDQADMILSSQTIFLKQERGIDYFFRYDVENPDDVLNALMTERKYGEILPSRLTMQNGRKTEKMVWMQSMCSYSGKKVGTFVFPLNSKEIENLLIDTYIPAQGWMYMENVSGETIMEIESEDGTMKKIPQNLDKNGTDIFPLVLDQEAVYVIRYESPKTGIRYTAVIPEKNMSAEILEEQKIFFGWIFLVTFLGGIIIILFSLWRGRKLSGILSQNERLSEAMKQQEPMMKGFLIEKLLKSDEESIRISLQNLQQYGIEFSALKQYGTVVFKMRGEDGEDLSDIRKIELCKILLHEKVFDIFREDFWECSPELSINVVLFAIDADIRNIRNRWHRRFEELTAWFAAEQKIRLDIMVSGICPSIQEVHNAYDQMQEILEFQKDQEYQIYYYDEYKKQTYFYYYPITLEERLMNAVNAGDEKLLHDQLKQIYSVNVLERELSASMMHFMLNDMQCTILKLLHSFENSDNMDLSSLYEEAEAANVEKNLMHRLQKVTEIFKKMCKLAASRTVAVDEELADGIERYLMENYNRQDLSLVKISEDFGYESSYFSKRFKGIFGENFVVYLEKIRIQHICELLQTDMTLDQIAEKTGYNSSHVMRTAFKRNKGCTPNEWKKLKKE